MHDANSSPASAAADLPAATLARYHSYFRTQQADTPALVRTAQAIRYQVYCLERAFEDPCQQDEGLERDLFDTTAVHSLLLHRPTSDAIGTVRLILPRTGCVSPAEALLAANGFRAGDYFPLESTAEVSRFAISNQFRRSRCDGVYAAGGLRDRRELECRGTLPCLGLIQEVTRQSVALGITHWAAVMEPKLMRMLASIGIHFTPVGPLVSHHGLRQPSYGCIATVLERLRRERPDHWMVVTDGGALMPEIPTQRQAA
jgi:N-acyl amino acid synthase of PEP-CTERM/exosortase system